jgi:membrane-associated phospholipid phosphatase
MLTFLGDLDVRLLYFINVSLSNSLTDFIMPILSKYGWLFFIPWIVHLFFKKDKNHYILFFAVFALLVSDFCGNTLKELTGRVRPCHLFSFVKQLVGCGKGFSFPSNHAANSFAVAAFLYFTDKKIRAPLVIAGLIAISRVFVGAHFPFDVAAGAILGIAIGFAMYKSNNGLLRLKRNSPWLAGLIILLIVISMARILYVKYAPVDLSGDEAHYWEWSRNLDLSYYSKGPLIAYIIFIGTKIFGSNELGVRFFAVLFSALSSLVMYAITYRITKNDRQSFFPAILLQVIPIFSVMGILMTIDSPFLLMWLICLYVFYEIAEAGKYDSYILWSLLGILIGLGMLAKYTMVFFYFSMFIFFLISDLRKSFWRFKGLYLSIILTSVVFLPVIIWNSNFGWVTLKHTAYHAKIYEGFKILPSSFFEFLGAQIVLVSPVIFVLIFFAFKHLDKTIDKKFIYSFFLPTFLFFLVKSIQGRVQGNWAMAAYPIVLIPLSFYSLDIRKGKLFGFGIFVALFMAVITYLTPYIQLPPEYNAARRIMGWNALGKVVDEEITNMPKDNGVFIFSDDYQISGLVSFYVKDKPFVYCVNLGRRMNQYDIWKVKDGKDLDKFKGFDAVFVPKSSDANYDKILGEAFNSYEKVEKTFYNKKAFLRKIYIYRCYGYKGIEELTPRSF